MTRLEPLKQLVTETLEELDGVLALRSAHGFAAPYLFTSKEELADLAISTRYAVPATLKLIMDAHPESKLGIICRGCEERGLIEMAKRAQINLEDVKVIGLACTAEEAEEWGCTCEKPYPSILTDTDVGDRIESASNRLIEEFLQKNQAEKLDFWHAQFNKCIKCYACRTFCPQCFCPECTLEDGLWVDRGRIPPPFPMFHLIRAMHTAAKCVGCRECTLVCPAHIPLGTLYALIRREVDEMFGYLTGSDLEERPPMTLPMEDVNGLS